MTLRHLGTQTSTPSESLDLIEWEHGAATITISCEEFTSLCPVTKQPDFGRIVIEFPFHSADSSAWKTVDMYGRIIVKDGNLLHPTHQWTVPNVPSPTKQRYRKYHVQRYLELEEMLKFRWARELAPLGDWSP